MDIDQHCDRMCWVCYGKEEDDRRAEWLHPCRCRGSTKWVHKACLESWVETVQKGDHTVPVTCPVCTAEYHILFPNLGPVVCLLALARCAAVNHGAAIMQAPLLVRLASIPAIFFLGRSLWKKKVTHPIILNYPEEDEAVVPLPMATVNGPKTD